MVINQGLPVEVPESPSMNNIDTILIKTNMQLMCIFHIFHINAMIFNVVCA